MYYTRSMFTDYSSMNKILDENNQKGALWLGDFSAASDKQLLKEKNIKTVLTTASGLGITYQPQDCIVHHQYNLLDNQTQNISHCFDATYKDIDEGLKRGGVLVHCAAGISRSATCVIAYLMRKNNTSFQETLAFVREKRRGVCPNLGFEKQLKSFQAYLNKESHRSETSLIAKNVNQKKNRQQQLQMNQNNSGNQNKIRTSASMTGNQSDAIGASQTPKKPIVAGSQQKQLFLSVQKETENFLNWEKNETAKKDVASLVEMLDNQPGKKMPTLSQIPRSGIQQPKVRLLSMGNQNMNQLLALKLSQNDSDLKIISLNKKIISPTQAISSNQNTFNTKEGKIPQSLVETKFNCVGPNIVTYTAQGELRASSRGPVQLHNRKNHQNNNRISTLVTMTKFRKQPF